MSKRHLIDVEECSSLPTIQVSLYHSPAKLIRDLAERGVDGIELDDDVPAQSFAVDLDFGHLGICLLDRKTASEAGTARVLGILCHEAVHLAERYFERIGEDRPGEEERAYVTQAYATGLIVARLRWSNKHGEEART